jgi:gamma-glutamyltranspeptidase/glutathione hydrolase
MGAAHDEHGRVAWSDLLAPAERLAREGFSFGPASVTYLAYSHQLVFGHDPASHAAVHRPDGSIRSTDDAITMPDLARSFEILRREGARAMHDGTLAEMIVEDMGRRHGLIGWTDLADYEMQRRKPLAHRVEEWEVDTNPAPAIGGEAVMGVLERIERTETSPTAVVAAQREVFERRRAGDPLRSPSTIHISVVDEEGGACALTASAGYGSGVIPTGTGIWMNNALGELELVSEPDLLVPGTRLTSNMAPTVAKHRNGSVLAIGSPGADRITSALAQTLAAFTLEGHSLEDAVAKPRLHVIVDGPEVAIEPNIDTRGIELPIRRFEDLHMFFGGVGAALIDGSGRLSAVADPRRDGAAGVSA